MAIHTDIDSVLSLMVPSDILSSFVYRELLEDNDSITILLDEKMDLLPPYFHANKCEAVLNGFCNPLEIQTFPQKGKPTYLRLYRRRWKPRGGRTSYYNTYDFHEPDAKLTDPFAFFLKDTP